MRQSWKELWELNKLSVKWVAKHWKGYTLALIICYGIGYILGTGGFKNCKTYIENKLKNQQTRRSPSKGSFFLRKNYISLYEGGGSYDFNWMCPYFIRGGTSDKR